MNVEPMVKMANDIADFFRAEPNRADAVAGIANHLQRFWDPRMRRAIMSYAREGGEGLDDLAREAIAKLTVPASAQ